MNSICWAKYWSLFQYIMSICVFSVAWDDAKIVNFRYRIIPIWEIDDSYVSDCHNCSIFEQHAADNIKMVQSNNPFHSFSSLKDFRKRSPSFCIVRCESYGRKKSTIQTLKCEFLWSLICLHTKTPQSININ